MGVFGAHWRRTALALALAAFPTLAVTGCGGGGDVQDAGAPRGNFPVEVTDATFPSDQSLAKTSQLMIAVRNAGSRTIPNINVTTKCGPGLQSSFETLSGTPNVADPRRPQFVVETIPTREKGARPPLDPSPLERSSVLADTFPLGPLAPGQTAVFKWKVTAVIAGPYRVCYHVNADLYGDAHPVPTDTSLPLSDSFDGFVSNVAPNAGIAPNGHTVTTTTTPGG